MKRKGQRKEENKNEKRKEKEDEQQHVCVDVEFSFNSNYLIVLCPGSNGGRLCSFVIHTHTRALSLTHIYKWSFPNKSEKTSVVDRADWVQYKEIEWWKYMEERKRWLKAIEMDFGYKMWKKSHANHVKVDWVPPTIFWMLSRWKMCFCEILLANGSAIPCTIYTCVCVLAKEFLMPSEWRRNLNDRWHWSHSDIQTYI